MWSNRLIQLTEKQRDAVSRLADDGLTLAQLAKRYGVSIPTIFRIVDDRRKKKAQDLVSK